MTETTIIFLLIVFFKGTARNVARKAVAGVSPCHTRTYTEKEGEGTDRLGWGGGVRKLIYAIYYIDVTY